MAEEEQKQPQSEEQTVSNESVVENAPGDGAEASAAAPEAGEAAQDAPEA